jgi:DNA-binding transcriptional LysR family regulator
MELRQLRYFIAVAEELHFARAAARVGIEQSPLSKAISEMERHLGVRLFVRTRRSTQLTYVGETLLPDARRIIEQVDQAQRNIRAAASGRRGRLRIAICDGLAHPRIGRLLAASREEAPEVDIQIMHNALPVQLGQLYSGLLDVAFSLSPRDDQQLQSVPLWKDAVVLIMRPDHSLSAQASIGQIDVRTGRLFLLGEHPAAATEQMDDWLLSSEQMIDSIEYVVSIELLLTLVAAGYGVGLISVAQAQTIRRPDLIMRPLSIRGATITTFLIRRRHDPSSVVARFTELAQKSA